MPLWLFASAVVAVAAAIWEALAIASVVATVWWIGPGRRETWLALGIPALPIARCLVIAQVHVPLTLFTAIGAPWSIALAANIGLWPSLITTWWIGRRDWRNPGIFVGMAAALALIQLVLAPGATLDCITAIILTQSVPSPLSRRTPSHRCCGARSSSLV